MAECWVHLIQDSSGMRFKQLEASPCWTPLGVRAEYREVMVNYCTACEEFLGQDNLRKACSLTLCPMVNWNVLSSALKA